MFAYCNNNPINYVDYAGTALKHLDVLRSTVGGGVNVGGGGIVIPLPVFPSFDHLLDVANDVKAWVESKKGVTEYRDHSVYVLKDPFDNDLVKYVGRTNDPKRREWEHKHDPSRKWRENYEMVVLLTGLTMDEARTWEQFLISAYTVSYLENARREISVKNVPEFQSYIYAVTEIYTGIPGQTISEFMLRR